MVAEEWAAEALPAAVAFEVVAFEAADFEAAEEWVEGLLVVAASEEAAVFEVVEQLLFVEDTVGAVAVEESPLGGDLVGTVAVLGAGVDLVGAAEVLDVGAVEAADVAGDVGAAGAADVVGAGAGDGLIGTTAMAGTGHIGTGDMTDLTLSQYTWRTELLMTKVTNIGRFTMRPIADSDLNHTAEQQGQ